MEFKNTMKSARTNLELPLESAMACTIHSSRHGETRAQIIPILADQDTLVSFADHKSARTRLGKTEA